MAVIKAVKSTAAGWDAKYDEDQAGLSAGGVNMLFIGDSITQHWETVGRGRDVWNQYYLPRLPLNLGIGGDRVENVLWRVNHHDFSKCKPKVIVLLIGTNNIGNSDDPDDIIDTLQAVLTRLRSAMPAAKIIILGLLPREDKPYKINRIRSAQVSGMFSQMALNTTNCTYQNCSHLFLQSNHLPVPGMWFDLVHPATAGYTAIAQFLEPLIVSYLGA